MGRRQLWVALSLVLATAAIYSATAYGGIRSPDAEVMYRTSEALVGSGSTALSAAPEEWDGFGTARGKDGKLYSVFGPLLPVALVPAVWAAITLEPTGWYQRLARVPPSHWVADGIRTAMFGTPASDEAQRQHARRMLASLTNVIIGALGVLALWRLLLAVTRDEAASLLVAAVYGLGTMAWSYAGTLMSEPLTTLLALVAMRALLRRDAWGSVLAGVALGLATASHVTALLFVPFFGGLALADRTCGLRRAALGAAGLTLVLALLGGFNFARFGDVLETGRHASLDAARRYEYGHWMVPWRGMLGLLVSPGKGLLLYCPAVLLGVFTWRSLHRLDRSLSVAIASIAITRIVFLGARSDWHGGFCLGPRLLLPIVPLLLVPVGAWLADGEAGARRRKLVFTAVAGAVLSIQQLYFALGEPFRYLHLVRLDALRREWVADSIYFAWEYSPLLHLWRAGLGSWAPLSLDLSLATAMALGSLIIGASFVALARVAWHDRRATSVVLPD